MICWLASYPRSGNTLLRNLVQTLFGLETCSIYDEEVGRSVDSMTSAFGYKEQAVDLKSLRKRRRQFLVKTHELPHDLDDAAMCVIRDGRDALVSYAHFLLRFEPQAVSGMTFLDVVEALIYGELGYGNWSHHVSAWRQRSAPTLFLRYEELAKRPYERIAFALRQLSIDFKPTGKAVPSFEAQQNQFPEFFRRGVAGGWRDELPPHLVELFMREHGEVMESLGYECRRNVYSVRRAA